MFKSFRIRRHQYYDSVFLMRAAKQLAQSPAVAQAILVMGTDKNKALLTELGFATEGELKDVTVNDLIMALEVATEKRLREILDDPDVWLKPPNPEEAAPWVASLNDAVSALPDANLAVISVPGAYAAKEAEKALNLGLNVFLFSNNVALEEEVALKKLARARDLLVMGPDCGTAIVKGVGIGFANVVRRGAIGVIGASGTGMQEFTSLVHLAGAGISHALGVGGRDLTDEVGGISTWSALAALEADEDTKTIVIISKPPGPQTLAALGGRLARCSKPLVTCFLGLLEEVLPPDFPGKTTTIIDDAVREALGGAILPAGQIRAALASCLIEREVSQMNSEERYIRGLYAGGTFCYQAQHIFSTQAITAYSNAPIKGNRLLPNPHISLGHTLVDLGADEFTVSRPHPMIDSRERHQRILSEGQDRKVAVLLLDFVLGFNAAQDPAGELLPAIIQARNDARRENRHLTVIASICGTDLDPQSRKEQKKKLIEAGVIVMETSAQAANLAALFALRLSPGGQS